MKRPPVYLIFTLLFCPPPAFSNPITMSELGGVLKMEYNRVFTNCFEFETNGGMEILRFLNLEGGISVGSIGPTLDFNSYARLGVQPLSFIQESGLIPSWTEGSRSESKVRALRWLTPLQLNLNYIHNNIPDFKTSIHSIIPYLSWEGRRAGISLGINFRYTVFNYEAPIDESIFVFSLYLNLINNQQVKLGIRYANFNNFLSGNMGSYSLSLYSSYQVWKILYLRNDIELLQTGSVGLAANFYGVRYTGGVAFRW